jgi:hypothetical protein
MFVILSFLFLSISCWNLVSTLSYNNSPPYSRRLEHSFHFHHRHGQQHDQQSLLSYPNGADHSRQSLYYIHNVSLVAKIHSKYSLYADYSCDHVIYRVKTHQRASSVLHCVQAKYKSIKEDIMKGSGNDPSIGDVANNTLVNLWKIYEKVDWSKPQCEYEWSQVSTSFSAPYSAARLLKFHIRQYNCSSDSYPSLQEVYDGKLLGGSSFAVTSVGTKMSRCSIFDHFNNSYDIYCDLNEELRISTSKKVDAIVNSKVTNCVNISVSLDYEYFNAFNDFIFFVENRKFIHPLRYSLIDNRQYCIDVSPESLIAKNSTSNNKLQLVVDENSYFHPKLKYSFGYWKNSHSLQSEQLQMEKILKMSYNNYVWYNSLSIHHQLSDCANISAFEQ